MTIGSNLIQLFGPCTWAHMWGQGTCSTQREREIKSKGLRVLSYSHLGSKHTCAFKEFMVAMICLLLYIYNFIYLKNFV